MLPLITLVQLWCSLMDQALLYDDDDDDDDDEVTCSQVWWPILGSCALHLTHPSAHTHTHSSEHTPREVGEQLGVRCLAQGSHLCRGIEGGENARYSLPPPTNPQPRVTSPMLYPLGHNCPFKCKKRKHRSPFHSESPKDPAQCVFTFWSAKQNIFFYFKLDLVYLFWDCQVES